MSDEILENQIGDFGGDEGFTDDTSSTEKPKSLGKAQYADRSTVNKISRDDANYDAPIRLGKLKLDREEMGERAQFYPEGWEFWIKPASVQDLKSWSSIDETKLDQINKALNEILKSCLTIKDTTKNTGVPWSRINSWDRLWFLMKIREYTFVKGENSIEYDADCIYCDNQIHYKLTSDALVFDAPDMDAIGNHWDVESMSWAINPKDYDVQSPRVILYNPNLEKEEVIINWMVGKMNNDKTVDESFVQFLPWLLPRVSRDQRAMDRLILDAEGIYKSWSLEMYEFMLEVLDNIVIKPSEQLKGICAKCGEEVVSQIRFPDGRGLKSLFGIQGKHKKFGSK